jgi:hypothetical protein
LGGHLQTKQNGKLFREERRTWTFKRFGPITEKMMAKNELFELMEKKGN